MEFVGIFLLLAPLGAVALYVNWSRLMALREAMIAARSGGSVASSSRPAPGVDELVKEAEPEKAEAAEAPEAVEDEALRRMQV